jgi:DNA-binding transcriptional ArsR family regulator
MSGIRMFGFRYYDEEPVDPDLPEHLGAVHRADWIHLIARMKIKGRRKDVALMLASSASEDGSDVRPALRTIGDMCDLHEDSVSTHIKTLLELGMLVVKRPGGGRGKPTVYRLTRPMDLATLPLWLDPDMKRIPVGAGLPVAKTPESTRGNDCSSNIDSPASTQGFEVRSNTDSPVPTPPNTYSPEFTKGVSEPGQAETPESAHPFSTETPEPTQGYRPVDNSGEAQNPRVSAPKPPSGLGEIAETPEPTRGDLLQADPTPDQTPGLPQADTSLGWHGRAAPPAAPAALVGPPTPEPWTAPPAPTAAADPPPAELPAPPDAPRIVHAAAVLAPTPAIAAVFALLDAQPNHGEWWTAAARAELRREGIAHPTRLDLAIRAAMILHRDTETRTA